MHVKQIIFDNIAYAELSTTDVTSNFDVDSD